MGESGQLRIRSRIADILCAISKDEDDSARLKAVADKLDEAWTILTEQDLAEGRA